MLPDPGPDPDPEAGLDPDSDPGKQFLLTQRSSHPAL